jgi:hypothetical protein
VTIQVVAKESDVDHAERHGHTTDLAEQGRQEFGEGHAAGLQSNDDDLFVVTVALEDFVGHAAQCARHVVGGEKLGTGNERAASS